MAISHSDWVLKNFKNINAENIKIMLTSANIALGFLLSNPSNIHSHCCDVLTSKGLPRSCHNQIYKKIHPTKPNTNTAEAVIKRICFMPVTLRLTGSGVNAVGGARKG
jgi:hypothetical protein